MSPTNRDLIRGALVQMGYKPALARTAAGHLTDTDRPLDVLLREALRYADAPLDRERIAETIRTEREAGYPTKQAAAIAYDQERRRALADEHPHLAGALAATKPRGEMRPHQRPINVEGIPADYVEEYRAQVHRDRAAEDARHEREHTVTDPDYMRRARAARRRMTIHENQAADRAARPWYTNPHTIGLGVGTGICLALFGILVGKVAAHMPDPDPIAPKAPPPPGPTGTSPPTPGAPCADAHATRGTVRVPPGRGNANVRSDPWGHLVGGLPDGTAVELLGTRMAPEPGAGAHRQARWYQIRAGAITGWLHSDLVRC